MLDSLAEVSVTLAAFAAVFRAFVAGSDPEGHSTVRLNAVIEGGLLLAFLYSTHRPGALGARRTAGTRESFEAEVLDEAGLQRLLTDSDRR